MADNRKTVEQFVQAMAASDMEAQDRLLADDIVEDYPQSGERIRGKQNRRGIIENYPGGQPQDAKAEGEAVMPEIKGAGDEFTVTSPITYPNGETWQYIGFVQLKDGKIAKIMSFFAAPFEAPAWRAPYVEVDKSAAEARSR